MRLKSLKILGLLLVIVFSVSAFAQAKVEIEFWHR